MLPFIHSCIRNMAKINTVIGLQKEQPWGHYSPWLLANLLFPEKAVDWVPQELLSLVSDDLHLI